jgi:hypothetical protein
MARPLTEIVQQLPTYVYVRQTSQAFNHVRWPGTFAQQHTIDCLHGDQRA